MEDGPLKLWRIVSRLGFSLGVFAGKGENDALELAYSSGKVQRGQKGIRVVPYVVGRGPLVTLSAAVLRVMAPVAERAESGYRGAPEQREIARLHVVAAEPELEQELEGPLTAVLRLWGKVEHGPGFTDHGRAAQAAVMKLWTGEDERLRIYVLAEAAAVRDAIEREVTPVARSGVNGWAKQLAEAGEKERQRVYREGTVDEMAEIQRAFNQLLGPPHVERGRARVDW